MSAHRYKSTPEEQLAKLARAERRKERILLPVIILVALGYITLSIALVVYG